MKIKLWDFTTGEFQLVSEVAIESMGNLRRFKIVQVVRDTIYVSKPEASVVEAPAWDAYVKWCTSGTVEFSDQGTYIGKLTGKILRRRILNRQQVVELDLGKWGKHTFPESELI